ncbi:aquaporin-like protein [Polychytrium aggregatum]|uniref:aquaporin-like protein n=1 Tax=Polychytrium aggregatum TaxID=110093 RepID=UPI0022FF2A9E|nr:aquaporin-like protein [Polychytrium aggregatum]KAI9193585.1 aquaporin-like protein [Polychytrium aggregatum]
MSATYTLGERCLTEFLATTMVMFVGLSVIANEILPGTKGHGMGFGWIAVGFMAAFIIPLIIFGYASAHVNPASCMALWVMGKISGWEFLALSASEMAGGFLGSMLMYLFYLPHFRTVPEPSGTHEQNLLRTRDHYDPSVLRFASYSTKSGLNSTKSLKERLKEARYYLTNSDLDGRPDQVLDILSSGTYHLHRMEVPFPVNESPNEESAISGLGQTGKALRKRHSLQVADMQWQLRKLEAELAASTNAPVPEEDPNRTARPSEVVPPVRAKTTDDIVAVPASTKVVHDHSRESSSVTTKEDAIYRAMIIADQNAKLSVFATRPSIYLPIHNCFAEAVATCALMLGAILIDNRFSEITGETGLVYSNGLSQFFIGLWIQTLVLGLGGPTGLAANPARDLAPRIAHMLLPIPGKGSSEMFYGLLINAAALVGGAVAGLLATAILLIKH